MRFLSEAAGEERKLVSRVYCGNWAVRLAAAVVFVAQVAVMPVTNAASKPVDTCSLRRGINLAFEFRSRTGDSNSDVRSRWPYLRESEQSGFRLTRVASDGFDFVRVLVDMIPLLTQPSDEGLLTSLADFTKRAQGLKLCVLLAPALPNKNSPWTAAAVFGDPSTADIYQKHLVRFAQMLAAMPSPGGGALELLNEPPGGCKDRPDLGWDAIQSSLYRAVRGVASNLPVVLSGSCWSSPDSLEKFNPTPFVHDQNTFYTVHFYEPQPFANQGLPSKACPFPQLSELPYPATASCGASALEATRAAIARDNPPEANQCERAAAAMISNYCRRMGTPNFISEKMHTIRRWAENHAINAQHVVVGEFGVEVRADWPDRLRWLGDVRRSIEAEGFGWAVWALGGSFSIECRGGPRDLVCPEVHQVLGLPGG